MAVVNYANRRGLRVTMNGNSHSVYGQAQVRNGIVIQASGLKRIHSIGEEGAYVDAGVTWGELAKAALARGLTPPVMTEFQELSIGGTLSVGGVGPASHRFGAQVDHVAELEVVTGSGERFTCSRERNNELFYAALAGFGQCGLILRARVRLVPAPTHVVVQELFYSDLATYLADALRALHADRFEHQLGHVIFEGSGRPMFRLKVGRFYSGPTTPDLAEATAGLRFEKASEPVTQTYWAYLNQRAATVRPRPRWSLPHATLYLFVPAKETERFLAQVLENPSEYAGARDPTLFGVFPWNARHFACPLFQVPRAAETFFVVYLFRTAPSDDLAAASAMVASNRLLYERARAVGGRSYPISALPFSTADWKDHFGPAAWRQLARAKREFDPNNILTPGLAIFGRGD